MPASPIFWIVNRDVIISERWGRLLRQQNWTMHICESAERFLSEVPANGVGLALIDGNCLGTGAKTSLASIKAKAGGVSIMITAGPGLNNERIIGFLEAGADDFFLHSMPSELLLAKLKAHLRRILPELARTLDVLESPSGDLSLDRAKREISIKVGPNKWENNATLTSTEFGLLAMFLERPGAALDRRFIIDALWREGEESIRPGTVDKHVESLRHKLGSMGSRIRTVYGVGYAYRDISRRLTAKG